MPTGYCFTVWIDGAAVNGPGDRGLSAKDLRLDDASVAGLCASPKQRAVSRAVYAEEYATSLKECMGDSEGSQVRHVVAHFGLVSGVKLIIRSRCSNLAGDAAVACRACGAAGESQAPGAICCGVEESEANRERCHGVL